jgi:hypothetical protein
MGGCTNCSSKGGCDTRKDAMFESLWETLARLYPTKRWGELDDEAAFEGGPGSRMLVHLREALADELDAAVYLERGSDAETCDYLWILCLGREPSLFQSRQGRVPAPAEKVIELYLRVALSTLAPVAAIQEVLLQSRPQADGVAMLTEEPRGGVFEPQLLGRMQKAVAVIGEHGLQHLDFGEIAAAPADYDGAPYREVYGEDPWVANYLFFPQSATTVTTRYVTRQTVMASEGGKLGARDQSQPSGAAGVGGAEMIIENHDSHGLRASRPGTHHH